MQQEITDDRLSACPIQPCVYIPPRPHQSMKAELSMPLRLPSCCVAQNRTPDVFQSLHALSRDLVQLSHIVSKSERPACLTS